jgi:hypothetical protein
MLTGMGVHIKTEKNGTNGSSRYLTHLTPPAARYPLKPITMTLPGRFFIGCFSHCGGVDHPRIRNYIEKCRD